jgi:hypothetical protein
MLPASPEATEWEMPTPDHIFSSEGCHVHDHNSKINSECDACRCATWRLKVGLLWRGARTLFMGESRARVWPAERIHGLLARARMAMISMPNFQPEIVGPPSVF